MSATATLADKLDVRLHTHLAETEDENKFCEQMYGCRPLDYLEQCGWLNARTWLAHGTQMVVAVYPDPRRVFVHRPGRTPEELRETDVLDGQEVVPGWPVSVRDFFD